MSQRPKFVCEHCGMPLGDVVHGGLRLLTAGLTILGADRAGITCPRCQRVRTWAYQQGMTTACMSG